MVRTNFFAVSRTTAVTPTNLNNDARPALNCAKETDPNRTVLKKLAGTNLKSRTKIGY